MSDIAERLRWQTDCLLLDAADEIERLRKTLNDHLESEAAETRRADRERDLRREAEAEIERLRATNHLEIVLPPFGHSFTLPGNRLDMAALEWLRENCVIVERAIWEKYVR